MNNEQQNLFSEIKQTDNESLSAVDLRVIILPDIPVIQMWQPWASWVVEGWKTIETRTHKSFAWMLNHKVAIHACKRWDDDALEMAGQYLTEYQRAKTIQFRRVTGCIIGTAVVKDFRLLNNEDSKNALIECQTERYGLFLENITKIEPITFVGKQCQLYISKAKL